MTGSDQHDNPPRRWLPVVAPRTWVAIGGAAAALLLWAASGWDPILIALAIGATLAAALVLRGTRAVVPAAVVDRIPRGVSGFAGLAVLVGWA
ncbi:MAG: hypothetical protein ACRDQ0_22345, partial [Pseudonocardia sp.]